MTIECIFKKIYWRYSGNWVIAGFKQIDKIIKSFIFEDEPIYIKYSNGRNIANLYIWFEYKTQTKNQIIYGISTDFLLSNLSVKFNCEYNFSKYFEKLKRTIPKNIIKDAIFSFTPKILFI